MSTKLKAGTASSGAVLDADTAGILELQSGSTPTTAITIDTAQNVGVGVAPKNWASGFTALQIGGMASLYSQNGETAGNGVQFTQNGYFDGTWKYIATDEASRYYMGDGTHRWFSAAVGTANNAITWSESMRIDSSGNVLVGTTNNPTAAKSNFYAPTTGNFGRAASFESDNTGSVLLCLFRNPNGTVGTVTTSGSSTSYVTSSDYRLKEDVTPMTSALAKVSLLKPVTYKWKVDGSSGQGFIAHELQEVVPECVTGEKNAVDEEGNPQYQGIDTSFLVATLTAAIQELNAKVTALEAQLGAK